ncbi:MAG: DUF3791 domain-containing protein [Bacteroidales bacterium]|jgi:hypothetical protein|nr:DUF3791 domain-containing protein [Bacteroidales bacterium]
MKNTDDINKFLVFCIESYKSALGLSGIDTLADFKDYGVFDYLSDGYEVLHTQGKEYIVADIKDFIKCRKQNETISR